MEKEKLNSYLLSGNTPVGAEYKSALQDLLHSFPYFQLAQVMYAKKIYDDNEPEAANRIKLASVYAPDRKSMYLLFKKEPERAKSEELRVKSEEKPVQSPKYNFVYSSPQAPAPPQPRKKEEEGLLEIFIKKELGAKSEVKKEPEKTAPVQTIKPPVEEKKPVIEVKKEPVTVKSEVKKEPEKTIPVQTTKAPVGEKKPVIEAKKEPVIVKSEELRVKSEEKPVIIVEKKEAEKTDTRKPYTAPTIVKKRSFYTATPVIKKPEPIKLPSIRIIPSTPKEEKKVEPTPNQPVKPIQTTPIEKKAEEKKVEPPKIEPVPIPKEEKKVEPMITKPIIPIEVPVIVEKLEDIPAEEPPVSVPVVKMEVEKAVEPITDTNLKFNFSSWLKVLPELTENKGHEPMPIGSTETRQMIDRFIEDSPKISRPKAEFFSPVKAAKMSITEDDTIVSETLAKIYLQQGSLQKALKAYETLLEQNPEKNITFAHRIEEIKALIKETTNTKTK